MHDPTPDVSLEILERLCDDVDVYTAAVILPGINSGNVLEQTCEWLDERGAKGLILMRFANTVQQGLILQNAPIIDSQTVQTVESFREMVSELNRKYQMKVSGTPLWDPDIGSPFAIRYESDLLDNLPRINRRASVLSGSIAAPFIDQILTTCGSKIPVVPVNKEISCLITIDDIKTVDPAILEPVVIIPGRAFIHDPEAQMVISRDGIIREIIRGPEMLTADAETSMGMTRDQVLTVEMNGFAELIQTINKYGR
jgi:methanogenesis marker radical SAM protein